MHPTATNPAPLPTSTRALYGAGQIGNQLFRDAPSMLLLFYLSAVIGIPPGIASAAIFIPKVFVGAISDLGVGILSDRNLHRFKRRNWLLLGAVLAPIAMTLTFSVPDISTTGQVIYVILGFSAFMVTFAVLSVPYLAHFAEISQDPHERTVLMAWKHTWTGAGLLLGSSFAPWLIHELGGDRQAYILAAAFLGGVSSLSMIAAWHGVRKVTVAPAKSTTLTLRALGSALTYRPFRILCLSAIVMTISAGSTSAAHVFFLTYTMGRPDALVQLGIILAIMGTVVFVASPLWVGVAKALGKRNGYLLAALGHCVTLAVWANVADGPIWIIYVCGALVAFFNSGWGLIVLSLLTDTIARAWEETGQDTAGAFAAIWSIIEKMGMAVGGTLVVGAILTIGGFDSAAARQGVPQSQEAIHAISYAFGTVPVLLKLIAVYIIWRYIPAGPVAKSENKGPVHAG